MPQPLESLLVRVELHKKPRCIPCFGDRDGALVVAKLEAGKDEASSYLPGRASGWDEDLNKAKWEEILAVLHWTLGRRGWERKAALGAGGKRSRRKRRLHLVAWMSGRRYPSPPLLLFILAGLWGHGTLGLGGDHCSLGWALFLGLWSTWILGLWCTCFSTSDRGG